MDQLEKRLKVAEWIAADFAGVIGEEAKKELAEWLAESEVHQHEYEALRQDFLNGQAGMLQNKEKVAYEWGRFCRNKRKKTFILAGWVRYAAIFVIALACILLLRWQTFHIQESLPAAETSIMMVAESPVLILSDGRSIPLNDTLKNVEEEFTGKIHLKDKTISYPKKDHSNQQEIYNTLKIPRGGEYKIQLADGTCVWLNALTELTYPVQFVGDKRTIYLKGEAYFEVAKDAGKPFIVKTSSGIEVKVLGTKFNLSSYEEDAKITTTLVEGSVEVSGFRQLMEIHPDEQVIIDKEARQFSRRQVNARMYIAWRDDLFIFDNQPLHEIMDHLKRWYEMEVFYERQDLKNYCFSGDLKKYDSFDRIIRMIEEVSGLRIRIKNKCVTIGTK